MKKLLYVVDDILIFVGCLLMIAGGMLISPVLAVYTAAIECFVLAYIYAKAMSNQALQDEKRRGGSEST